MSGPPHPHPPHGRQPPPVNAAWNHLQVPNFYPGRQPQHAHMSNEHSILHQPTWHTPTTEPMKTHSHIFSLEQMLSERQFQRHAPGVDLSLTTRNGSGNQNGELPSTPISLSVRDTNKINSLPVSALDIQSIESLKPLSPGVKSLSPGLGCDLNKKRSSKRVDSILERLTPTTVETKVESLTPIESVDEKIVPRSVIVTAAGGSHDENSNSSSIPPLGNSARRDDDVVSPYSNNEDSLDSQKSRRKRKPCKTVRLPTKEEPPPIAPPNPNPNTVEVEEKTKIAVKAEEVGKQTRREMSSESETIDNIAAMVQEGLSKTPQDDDPTKDEAKPICVSVIKTSEPEVSDSVHTTSSPKKPTITQFVEVENKLEEMFAGIEDGRTTSVFLGGDDGDVPKKDQSEGVTSTSSDLIATAKQAKKNKRKQSKSGESTGKKSKSRKQSKSSNKSTKGKKSLRSEAMKDVYAYDSASNASSSRSRGPFIQIKGPRDSPLSVSVINTPSEDDNDRKSNKTKKFHDDSEYRTKVRSKGLHCSTLSHQYDAQTKDATWICSFCKRGPHALDLTGPSNANCGMPAAGDLFGPYFITTNSPEYDRRLDDPFDKQFKSKKNTKCLDGDLTRSASGSSKKKRKHSSERRTSLSSGDDCFWGISPTGSGTFEVWAHEDCIVWSAGTYLIGPKIVGLEEAVWTSCNVTCVRCHLKGANICCVKRGCVNVVHVCCARSDGWLFDEQHFKIFCPQHRLP